MRLQELLNKFSNNQFVLTVDGWCDEMPFGKYPEEQKQDYWKKYKYRKVKSLAIIVSNGSPEFLISLEKEEA